MATIFTHALIPLAMRLVAKSKTISTPLMLAGVVATILPDADVIAFYLGIAYSDVLGHRGFTHSIGFAVIVGVIGAIFAAQLKARAGTAFWVLSLSTLSHAVLDAFTNGGLGVAILWPLSSDRYFMPWQPIEVSPIGISGFLTQRGLDVLFSELIWIVLPLAALILICKGVRAVTNDGQSES